MEVNINILSHLKPERREYYLKTGSLFIDKICESCGKTFKHHISHSRRFCTFSCRATHLNRNKKLSEETKDKIRIKQLSPERRELYLKHGRFVDKNCKKCGNTFKQDITKFDKEFCSVSCRQSWINSNRLTKRGKARKLFLPLIDLIRDLIQYRIWRKKVYKRDNFICVECGNKNDEIHAHHKKQFGVLFREFLQSYNQFSPIDDRDILVKLAIDYKPFWDINNGATLCIKCHCCTKGRHKYANTISS